LIDVVGQPGLAPAVRSPVKGIEPVAFLSRFSQVARRAEVATLLINARPPSRVDPAGEFNAALTFVVENGRIARIYAIRNPQPAQAEATGRGGSYAGELSTSNLYHPRGLHEALGRSV
jgi:hypothetical protein